MIMYSFCMFINMADIMWFAKHQGMVGSAVFGAEFMVIKQGMEAM